MIRRLAVYGVESALLAVLLWLGVALAAAGLRRLGRPAPQPGLRGYLQIWVATVVIDVAGSELRGPEFLLPYGLAVLAPLLGGLLWAGAALRRRLR